MANSATVNGSISVIDANNLLLASYTLAMNSGNFNVLKANTREIAPNTAAVLDVTGFSNIRFVWVRSRSTATGLDKSVLVTLNSVTNPKPSVNYLHQNSDDPATTSITSVTVTTKNDGVSTTIDYILGG